MATPIACFTCGGSYTADQRRRHEQTALHQGALAPAVYANVKELNGKGQKPMSAPETVQTGSSDVGWPQPPKAKGRPGGRSAAVADMVVTGDPVEFWARRVKIWAQDVRYTERHDPGLTKILETRKARLAEAQAMLDAAKGE
jgi:hypothetical protein